MLQIFASAGALLCLAILVVGFGLANSNLVSPSTLLTIAGSSAPLIVAAAAMIMCLICAEVDLSIVGVIGLSSTIVALLLNLGLPWPLAVLAGVLSGSAVGLINGLLTSELVAVMPFFPSFFPTLATTALATGLAEALPPSKQAIAIRSYAFAAVIGLSYGAPVLLIYALLVVLALHLVLRRTKYGYHVEALGANRRAAQFVGVDVKRTKILVMTASGSLASFAGVLTAGLFQAGYSQLGKGYDLDALGAAVIGGTALFGSQGNVVSSTGGTLVLAALNNGLQLLEVSSALQLAANGVLVVGAVALDLFVRRRLATL